MKKSVLIIPFLVLAFASCKTSQLATHTDDVYSSPAEEKRLAALAEAEKAKKDAEEKKKQEEARLAQQAKEEANPYYKDPSFNQDDYYDYQYASRVRRFSNPVYGAGYYDNYYTNQYYYNQNPACYGSSIYSSYSYWMPSNQFNNYSNGLSFCLSSGNYWGNGYNPYGYNPYGYNGYNNGYYNGYNNGYYNGLYGYGYNPYGYNGYGYNPYGFNNFNNGGWGYFNSHDVNSGYSTYGVRGSNGGSNSPRSTSGGMAVPSDLNGERGKFIKDMQEVQESTPRFTDVPRNKGNISNGGNTQPGRGGYTESPAFNTGNGDVNTNPSTINNNPNNGGTKVGGGRNTTPVYDGGTVNETPRSNGGSSTKTANPVKVEDNSWNTNKTGGWNNNGNSNNGNSGSSPRGGSGSSNTSSRPR
jgi:hypothetical protein